jgi:2-dehydropantoate 2-reductase
MNSPPLLRKFQNDMDVQLCHDIESRIWFKLFVNSAINPLTALYNIPNGRLLQAPQLMRVAEDVVNEAVNVAIKKGVTHLLPGNEENMPDYRDDARIICKRAMERVRLVATRTAANRSSMLSDIDRGRPTEIDSINGYIARIGKELGVDISINRTLVRLVKAKEHPRLQSE